MTLIVLILLFSFFLPARFSDSFCGGHRPLPALRLFSRFSTMTSMADVPAYMLPGAPVLQPPHLEGLSDPTLSTEVLPGPPSLVSIRRTVQKRDPKNSSVFVSYLPPSDPGSTYSGLMAGPLAVDIGGSRRKRARVDKGTANGRAQRANARSLNNSILPALDPVVPEVPSRQPSVPLPDSDSFPAQPDSDDPSLSLSRANSQPGGEEGIMSVTNGRGRTTRKDKGKGKEIDRGFIKEEPVQISLSPEPSLALPNDDHCSSCRSLGALVYCDSCPRAFHLWCLDPPMEAIDLPEGDKWFCPSCIIRKHPPSKPTRSSFMSPLLHQLQVTIPKEFQLPDDIRNFFKDVSTATNGAYVDSSELKQLRLNRHGQLEVRDPYRLKDRNGIPIICFRCGQSSLPRGGVVASTSSMKCSRRSTSTLHSATPETWRSMLSCDYCNLHWHLDCLDPPLTSMPSYGKKWMCPNHAEQVLQPKRRIPKQNATPIDITKPNQWNSGNIEVIHPQPAAMTEKLVLDEVLINGRRYRVPERIIMLDFWSKISRDPHQNRGEDPPSRVSSPLTSLSSLDEVGTDNEPTSEDLISRDELHAAQLLFDLHHSLLRRTAIPTEKPTNIQPALGRVQERTLVDSTTQTVPDLEPCAVPSFPRTVEQSDVAKPTTHKRKASSRATGRGATETEVPLQAQAPNELLSPAKPKRARVAPKQEQDEELRLADDLTVDCLESAVPARPGRQGRGRRKLRQAEMNNNLVPVATSSSIPIATESLSTNCPTTPIPVAPEVNHVPPVASTSTEGLASKPPPTSKASMTITQSSTSSTPTLKIRLPRLSAVSAAAHANLTAPASQSPSSSISPAPEADARLRRRSLRRQDSASVSVSGASSSAPDDLDEPDLAKPKPRRRQLMALARGGAGRRGRGRYR